VAVLRPLAGPSSERESTRLSLQTSRQQQPVSQWQRVARGGQQPMGLLHCRHCRRSRQLQLLQQQLPGAAVSFRPLTMAAAVAR
jgi:hypothetical protein